jgi:hypothetical protein
MDFVYAALIAVPLAALLLCGCALVNWLAQRRDLREMATFACPACSRPAGPAAIKAGRDISPWEELWTEQGGELVHCHPVCRSVICPGCGHSFVIRLNCEGQRFGPRLSVDED